MPDPDPDPRDPFAPLAEGATAMHKMFLSFTAAGFTETQALYLVVQIGIGGQQR